MKHIFKTYKSGYPLYRKLRCVNCRKTFGVNGYIAQLRFTDKDLTEEYYRHANDKCQPKITILVDQHYRLKSALLQKISVCIVVDFTKRLVAVRYLHDPLIWWYKKEDFKDNFELIKNYGKD